MSGIKEFCEIEFDISKIVLCGMVRRGSGTPTHRNRASHGLVLYPEGGSEFSFLDGKHILPLDSSIVYLPKGSDYDVASQDSCDCYAINFDTTTPFTCSPFLVTVRNLGYFLDAFRRADREFKMSRAGGIMSCKSILCGIISTLQFEYSLGYVSNSAQSMLAPALECIHETYTENTPTIPELARLCGVSSEYFRSVFRRTYGKPPVKYIADLRLERARELILSGMYSISDAAYLSGFSDPSYFSREFKKHFGVTASEVGTGVRN